MDQQKSCCSRLFRLAPLAPISMGGFPAPFYHGQPGTIPTLYLPRTGYSHRWPGGGTPPLMRQVDVRLAVVPPGNVGSGCVYSLPYELFIVFVLFIYLYIPNTLSIFLSSSGWAKITVKLATPPHQSYGRQYPTPNKRQESWCSLFENGLILHLIEIL